MSNPNCKCPFACAENAPCIAMTTQIEVQKKMLVEILKVQKAIHKEIKIVSSKVDGDYTPPNQRKSANERLVQKAISKYWELIKSGTPERDALAMACHAVENVYGLGGYKSFESFRTVVNRELKENRHSLVESNLTLAID